MPDAYGNELETDPVQLVSPEDVPANIPRATIRPQNAQGTDDKNVSGTKPVENNKADSAWMQIQEGLTQGQSRQQLAEMYAASNKISLDDADEQIVNSLQAKIKQAREAGFNDDEIKAKLNARRYDPDLVNAAVKSSTVNKSWMDYEFDPQTPQEDIKDLRDLYDNLYYKHSTTGKSIVGFFGNKELAIEARREVNQLNKSIASKLQQDGFDAYINPNNGDIMYRDANGMEHPVDSSMLNGLYNSKNEIVGSMAGAATGAKRGGEIGQYVGGVVGGIAGNLTGLGAVLPEELLTVPGGAAVGKYVGMTIGGITGGAGGAAVGRGTDLLLNSAQLKEELETKLVMQQMKDAAIFDGVANIVGSSFFRLGKEGYKGVMNSFKYFTSGNTKGAYRALLDNMEITDEQAKEIVSLFESTTGAKAAGNTLEEKAVSVVSTTQQGVTESFIRKVAAQNPRVATSIVKDINTRAKDIYTAINNVSGERVGARVQEDLNKYVKDVKSLYGDVKKQAVDVIGPTDFRFDAEQLSLEPVMKSLENKFSGSVNREKFLGYASRIANASEDRTFNGLIELRQAVNDFKYSKTGLLPVDKEALDAVINKIDGQINKAVKTYMPDQAGEWQKWWKTAKTEYAKMKQLEENVLFNALTKEGTDPTYLDKQLTKYINATDDTFSKVLEKLPPKRRSEIEAKVIDTLTKKYTVGDVTSSQGINFPALSTALKDFALETPQAKGLAKVIDEYAKVFKNDQNLVKLTGSVSTNKMSGILTDDVVVVAKLSFVRAAFDAIQKYVPTETGRNIALADKMSKLLRDPMNVKFADDYIKSLPKDAREEALPLLKQMRQAMAETGQGKPSDFKFMYKQTKSGKLTVTDGALGKGIYLREGVKNADPASKVVRHEVNMSRMATLQDISSIVGRDVTEKELRNIPDIQKQLADKGYLGVNIDNKVMLFPDNVLGVK